MSQFTDKIALVTGAGTGNGEANSHEGSLVWNRIGFRLTLMNQDGQTIYQSGSDDAYYPTLNSCQSDCDRMRSKSVEVICKELKNGSKIRSSCARLGYPY